jgi:hypothetical protein
MKALEASFVEKGEAYLKQISVEDLAGFHATLEDQALSTSKNWNGSKASSKAKTAKPNALRLRTFLLVLRIQDAVMLDESRSTPWAEFFSVVAEDGESVLVPLPAFVISALSALSLAGPQNNITVGPSTGKQRVR